MGKNTRGRRHKKGYLQARGTVRDSYLPPHHFSVFPEMLDSPVETGSQMVVRFSLVFLSNRKKDLVRLCVKLSSTQNSRSFKSTPQSCILPIHDSNQNARKILPKLTFF
jgi:hypothetical protein